MQSRTRNAIVTASISRNLTVGTPIFLVAGIARVNLNLPRGFRHSSRRPVSKTARNLFYFNNLRVQIFG
ncbi:hypothetical protein BDV06DRAFT_186178 [Aspergillus oleicola]